MPESPNNDRSKLITGLVVACGVGVLLIVLSFSVTPGSQLQKVLQIFGVALALTSGLRIVRRLKS